jgi:Protein of unknown function (DUF4232)
VSACGAERQPECSASQLRLEQGGYVPPETGERARRFDLRNVGSGACVLRGYPGVRLLSSSRALRFTYRWGGRYFWTMPPPHRIVLIPGRAGWFLVAKYRCDGRTLRVADAISVIPPGATRRKRLRFADNPTGAPLGYCAAIRGPNRRDPGNTVYIGPIHA